MTFEEFVRHLGDVIGLDELAPQVEEDGISRFYLEMPDDLVITFMEVPEYEMVLTTCNVGTLPPERNREEFLLEMLEANGTVPDAYGETLSIDSEKEQVNLCRYDYLNCIKPKYIEEFLERFVQEVVMWHDRLGRLYDEDVPEEDTAPMGPTIPPPRYSSAEGTESLSDMESARTGRLLFEEYVANVSKILNRKDLVLEDKGKGKRCCRLELTKDIVISFSEDPEYEMLMTVCKLGPIPTENREKVFRNLLEANFMFNGTHGATLTVDRQENVVKLCRYKWLPAVIPSRIEESLAYFVSDVLKHHDRLFNPDAEPPKEGAEPIDLSGDLLWMDRWC